MHYSGIDVEVDVEHHGRRKKCHRFGMGGPWGARMRGGPGPWCMRGGPWGMRGRGGCRWGSLWAAANVATPQAPTSSASNPQGNPPDYPSATAADGSQSQGQQNATNLETGEMASGSFSGPPDHGWTVVENRPADVEGAVAGVRELDMSDKAVSEDMSGFDIPCKHYEA
jgi:hypothetical protein